MNKTELEVYDLIDRIQDKLTQYSITERYNAIVSALKTASKNRVDNLEFDYEVNSHTRKTFDYLRRVIDDPEVTDDDIKSIVVGANDLDESDFLKSKEGTVYLEKQKTKQRRGHFKPGKYFSLEYEDKDVVLPDRLSIVDSLSLKEFKEEQWQESEERRERLQNKARHYMERGGVFKRKLW